MNQGNAVELAKLAGRLVRHTRSRTLTAMDNTWYTLLTLNTANHFDVADAAKKGFAQLMMNSTFSLAVVIGILSREFGGEVGRRMTLREVRLVKSLFAGDSVCLESQVGAVEGDRISVASTGRNQNGDAVIEVRWEYPLGGKAIAELLKDATASAPVLDPERVFTPQVYGPAFEDFEIGQLIDHQTGRTMSRDESIWMSLLSMRECGLYHDSNFAACQGLPDILIDEFFVLSTVLGLGVKHSTQAAVANLGWKDIRFWCPVYPGDTVYSESEVTGARLSGTRPGQGIISLRTLGRNQRDEVVASYERSFLTYCRGAGFHKQ